MTTVIWTHKNGFAFEEKEVAEGGAQNYSQEEVNVECHRNQHCEIRDGHLDEMQQCLHEMSFAAEAVAA